ncbi:hypothetical protein Y032_0046g1299 [Ancylostoma ceylanicum]|uniref:Uncharacterized protein n=1 Tax=Ancylostoma ceylanicum TaxID=53326 RepID=A0A016UDB1_9BILA|nr:hypothetical protein Y032_0046g1299 [Ancylostoma ceylanicum]
MSCDESYYKYLIETYENGEKINAGEANFTCTENTVTISFKKNGSAILNAGGTRLVLNANRSSYFAIFANHMEHCPVFISLIDIKFGIWSRYRRMNVEPKLELKQRREEITVFYDIMGAFAVIILP